MVGALVLGRTLIPDRILALQRYANRVQRLARSSDETSKRLPYGHLSRCPGVDAGSQRWRQPPAATHTRATHITDLLPQGGRITDAQKLASGTRSLS